MIALLCNVLNETETASSKEEEEVGKEGEEEGGSGMRLLSLVEELSK